MAIETNELIDVQSLSPFKKFIMTIGNIPTSYLESMTYAELLMWFCNYLQETVIPTVNNNGEAVEELQGLYIQLKTFVDNYFDNLDVQQEINNKLDSMVESGELTTLIGAYVEPTLTAFESEVRSSLSDLETEIQSVASGSPLVASSTSGMTDTSRVYVNTTDGKWYYYDGDSWEIGGTYQSSGIADSTITFDMLSSEMKHNLNTRINDKDVYNFYDENEINLTDNVVNNSINVDGTIGTSASTRACTNNLYYIPKNANIKMTAGNDSYQCYAYFYDENMNFISGAIRTLYNENSQRVPFIVAFRGATYVRFRFTQLDNTQDITTSEVISNIKLKFIPLIEKDIYTKGTNMINQAKVITGNITSASYPYCVNPDNTSFRTTQIIPVKKNQQYYISRFRQLALYNINMVNQSVVNTDTSNYTFTPTADGFVALSYKTDYASSLIMCEGSSGTYTPYKEYLPNYIDLSNIIQSDSQDVLYDKKYVALGDSFTHGDFTSSPTDDYTITSGTYQGEYKVYPFLIGNRTKMDVTNLAVNGMTITNVGGVSENYLSDSVLEQIPEDVDYITIKIGINDDPDHQNAPLGTITSSDRTTFYGAWNYVMDYLITNYPQAKIGIIVSNGINSLDYINAELNIAKRYGVAFINEATDNNVPLLIRTMRTDVLSSVKTARNNYWEVLPGTNYHPNAKCHEYESTIIEDFLRRL